MLRTLAHALANAVAWFGITALGAAAILVDGVVPRGLAVGGAMASVAAAATWSVQQHFAGLAEESAMRSSMRDVVLGATEEATRQQVAALPRAIDLAKARTRRHRLNRGRLVIGVDPGCDTAGVAIAQVDGAGRIQAWVWPEPAGAGQGRNRP